MSAITERRDMGMYTMTFSMYLLGFGMGAMLAKFHMCGIFLRVSFQHAREECDYLVFFASWT